MLKKRKPTNCAESTMVDPMMPPSKLSITSFELEHIIPICQALDMVEAGEIILEIDSYGGCVHGLLKLISAMDAAHARGVVTIGMCDTMAASAGATVLSHCAHRVAAPDATIMIHEMSTGDFGPINDMRTSGKYQESLYKRLLNILSINTELGSVEDIDKLFKAERDIYLTAEEALEKRHPSD